MPNARDGAAKTLESLRQAKSYLSVWKVRLESCRTMGPLSEGGAREAAEAIDAIEGRLRRARRVRNRLAEIDPRLGIVFEMRYIEAMSWQQVMTCMGIAKSTAMALRRRVVSSLEARPELLDALRSF